MARKIDRVNGLILVERLPDKCACGGAEFVFEEQETGTDASCKQCYRLYMAFEKLLFEPGALNA